MKTNKCLSAAVGWLVGSAVLVLPLVSLAHVLWPNSGRVTSNYYSSRPYGYHQAIDIAGAYGEGIGATTYGTTQYKGYSGDYGNLVIVRHKSSYQSYYGHMSRFGTYAGEPISHNETIGYEGSTGNSTGPHCHFEIRRYGSKLHFPASVGSHKMRGATIGQSYPRMY